MGLVVALGAVDLDGLGQRTDLLPQDFALEGDITRFEFLLEELVRLLFKSFAKLLRIRISLHGK